MAKVFSFINYKGGVGKTTTTYHVGCYLAQHHGKKVLLIDIDPQTNLTFLCTPIEKWETFKKKNGTIASLYKQYVDKRDIGIKKTIWPSPIQLTEGPIKKLDLIPCDVELLGEDLGGGQLAGSFSSIEGLKKHASAYIRDLSFLKRVCGEVSRDYDYILIDCPPNLYLMTQNALVASNYYVVTTIPDHLSTIGLNILKSKVEKIGNRLNQVANFAGGHLDVAKLGGIVFVRVRVGGTLLTNVHARIMSEVERAFGKDACFDTYTTELIGYSEAAENQVPVWSHDTTNAKRAAKKGEYQTITDEFVRRF